jgi:putative inorganic carbon (hco3(-)) transporter
VALTERFTFNAGREGRRDAPTFGARGAAAVDIGADPDVAVEEPERRDWAFTLLLAFTAVVFFRPQDEIPGLHLLHLAELCALGGLTALVFSRLGRNQPITRITPELIGVVALGVVILMTAPFSIWFGGALGVFKELYVKVILIFLLTVNVLTSPRRIERLMWLLVIAGGYIGFRAVFDYVRGVNLIENGRVQGAVGGIFKNPNDLALNMVVLLPLAAFIILRPTSPPVRRLSAAGCSLFMLGAIVASHSRAGFLGLVAMLGVFTLYAIRKRPGLVIGGAIIAAMALPMLPSSYWERLSSITDQSKDDTGSREARAILLRESYQAFVENPITGVGAGQFKNWNPEGREQPWRESHDVFLQVAAELGIAGLVALLYLIARAFLSVRETRRLLRRSRRSRRPNQKVGGTALPTPKLSPAQENFFDAQSAAMAASLTGWLICALFASVAYNWTFYYLLALAAAPRDILLARVAVSRAVTRQRVATNRLEVARA